ncbi:hypothetical protein FAM14222_001606 [Propionibacterium freudenreichii]|uniref:hypothetical protein n=1 Tax=Propionibacterium freudenreichii TaxID=1744 RepID=UPI00254E206F|nr:hypothetical protein [Propionibacterium freudenreichii]MDK9593272.1 hypothetical protein [Propionibacterium freudenreichii]
MSDLIRSQSVNLNRDIAARIADPVEVELPRVREVDFTVHKPHEPSRAFKTMSGVTVNRRTHERIH